MNQSNWTKNLINTLTTFSVSVPSQTPYTFAEIFLETSQITLPKSPKTSTHLKTDLLGKLFLRKSTSYGTSGRSAKWKMLLFLSYFLQKLDFYDTQMDFYLMRLISTPVLHGKALFHLEPSGIYFLKNI